MARKDVNLIIRARDEASNALDRVNKALDEFRVAQSEVGADAGKANKTLGDLTKAINKVEGALSGLNTASIASKKISDAAAALVRLRDESARNAASLSETRAEIRKTTRSLKGYENTLSNLESKLEQTRAAQKNSAKVQKEAAAAADRARASQDKLVQRQADLPGLIERQSLALEKARERWLRLKDAMEKGTPGKTLKRDFEASTRAVAGALEKLQQLEGEFSDIGGKIAKAGKEFRDYGRAAAKAERDQNKAAETLAKLSARHEELTQKIRNTQTALRGLTSARGTGERGMAALEKDIVKASAALEQLQGDAKQADAALAGLRAEGASALEKQLVDQGLAAQKAEQQFRELREEATRYGAEIGKLGVPTAQQSQKLLMLRQAADQAELELLQQRETLTTMGQVYRATGNDIESVLGTMRKFAGISDQNAAAMTELANDGLKARNAIRQLHNEAERGGVRRLASDLRKTGNESRRAAQGVSGLRAVYNELYGGSRQALSINQRLRGEVLALIATYGGFYAVIRTLGDVVRAYQEIEAAQARLNVANDGNLAATGRDLDFLRRTADRLGVNFGVLAREYSKFVIATENTNLQGSRAREVFVAVTEAARVSRSSTEELKGVFTALVQIVSKGAVQMEELRQQLGDRLPGAIQIMADGLGISTAELIKMMEQGQITSDALVNFAEELKRRFGSGLPDALQSTSAELGRLQNAAFQALLAFGEAGFLESFRDLIKDLTETLRSAEFKTFSDRLSAAFGVVMDAIAVLVRNINTVGIVLGAALGLKAFRIVSALQIPFGNLRKTINANVKELRRFNTVLRVTSAQGAAQVGVFGRLGNSMKRLSILVRGLAASTGIGLVLTGIGAIVGGWLTQANALNEAMTTHRDIMDRVRNAYEEAAGSAEKWRRALKAGTEIEIGDSIRQLEKLLKSQKGDVFDELFGSQLFTGGIQSKDAGLNSAIKDLGKLALAMREGEVGAEEFIDKLDKFYKRFEDTLDNNLKDEIADVVDALRPQADTEAALAELRTALKALAGEGEEAEQAFDDLGQTLDDAKGDLDPFGSSAEGAADALEKLNEATGELKEGLRGLLSQNENLKDFFEEVEEQEALEQMAKDTREAIAEIVGLERAWQEMSIALKGTSFTGIFTELLTDLSKVYDRLFSIGSAVEDLGGRFGDLGSALSEAVGGAGNFLGAVMGNFSAQNTEALEDAVNRIIFRESEGIPDAAAETSTALGLGQFIKKTWLDMFKRYFPAEAARLSDQQILQLRLDPELSYEMTSIAVQSYAKALEAAGAPVNTTSLYLSHFLGPDRAIRALQVPGNTPFRDFYPAGAAANPTFANMSVQEVIGYFAKALRDVTPEQIAKVQQFNPGRGQAGASQDLSDRLDEQAQFLDDQAFEIRQQELINQGLERQAAVEKAMRDARQSNPYAGEEFYKRAGDAAGKLFDLEEQRRRAEDIAQARENTQQTLADAEFAIRQQELINAGKERQAEIEAALRSAREANPDIDERELDLLAARTAALYDLKIAQSGQTQELKAAEKAQEAVNNLLEQRAALEQKIELLKDDGQFEAAQAAQEEIEALNEKLIEAIANAEKLWNAVGGPEAQLAILQLHNARIAAENFAKQGEQAKVDWTQVKDLLVNGLVGAMDNFARAVANGVPAAQAAKEAFLQFAAEFLLKIAQMIAEAAILNALQAAFGGTSFGALIGFGTGHTGGTVGSNSVGSGRNARRTFSPMLFAGAPRYHSGGVIGLKPGEVPIIAKQGEEMLTREDPRHTLNGGGQQGAAPNVNIRNVNTFDAPSFLEAALDSPIGERVMLNFISARPDKFRAALDS